MFLSFLIYAISNIMLYLKLTRNIYIYIYYRNNLGRHKRQKNLLLVVEKTDWAL